MTVEAKAHRAPPQSSVRYHVADASGSVSPSVSSSRPASSQTPTGIAGGWPRVVTVPRRAELPHLASATQHKPITLCGCPVLTRSVLRYERLMQCVDRYQAAAGSHSHNSGERKHIEQLQRATEALRTEVLAKLSETLPTMSPCRQELLAVRRALDNQGVSAQPLVASDFRRGMDTPAPATPAASSQTSVWHTGEPDAAGGTPEQATARRIVKFDERSTTVSKAARRAGITGQWSQRAAATSELASQLRLEHRVPQTRVEETPPGKRAVMAVALGLPPQALGVLQVRLPAALNETLRRRSDLLAMYAKERGYTGYGHDAIQGELTLRHERKNARVLTDDKGAPMVDSWGTPLLGDVQGPIFTRIDYGRGDVRRALTELQWLDTMSGEMSRTGADIHLAFGDDGALVSAMGIDNETAFGPAINSADAGVGPAMPVGDGVVDDSPRVSHRARMPGVIGPALKQTIVDFDLGRLGAVLGGLPSDASQRLVQDVSTRLRDSEVLECTTDADWAGERASRALGVRDFAAAFDQVAEQARRQPAGRQTQALMSGLQAICNVAHDTSYVAREAAHLALQDWLAAHGHEWPGAPAAAPVYSHADLDAFMKAKAKEPRRLRMSGPSSASSAD